MTEAVDDPAAAPSLRRFEQIRRRTDCLYARGAQLWGSPDWTPGNFDAGIDRFAAVLVRLAAIPETERPDGAVLELREPERGASVEALAMTTRAVLGALTERDPTGDRCLDAQIEHPDWWFTFADQPFFLATFAPCYGRQSSRYAFGLPDVYCLFQTRHSFVRRWAPGTERLPDDMRRRIREAFARSDRHYDLAITTSPMEAHRYVKPDRLGVPPIRWWTTGGST